MDIHSKLQLPVPDDVRRRWIEQYGLDLQPGCSFMTVLLTVYKCKQDFLETMEQLEAAIIKRRR